jgi:hypothetical protein
MKNTLVITGMEYLSSSLTGSRRYPLVVITNGDDWIAAIDVLKIKESGCS